MKTSKKVLITTGDSDGIGLEVAEKALRDLGPQRDVHFFIWRAPSSYPKNLVRLKASFRVVSFTDVDTAFAFFLSDEMSSKVLVEVISDKSPAIWVETSARWCLDPRIHGMVTGPISKTEIQKSGMKDMGHTDILKRISKTSDVFMGFIGNQFSVLLATAHIPISDVPKKLSSETLKAPLLAADQLRRMLPKKFQARPLGVLGLNPHAGESGMIGDAEVNIFPRLLQFAQESKIACQGPLVPDAAFLKEQWKKYSVYLAMYHDQGLIPFKMIHGQDVGVHVSVGLPFIRTSVDHGTAKDIFGKNKANSASMRDAIQTCLRLDKSTIR